MEVEGEGLWAVAAHCCLYLTVVMVVAARLSKSLVQVAVTFLLWHIKKQHMKYETIHRA
jgi:hypothetical protein